ncbi:hypothetical protein [Latilactobacillus sakei]|uniref:hypothetical protein n=1 Tax=Latilactobacillus sakei TaxID=1599 RepID=UPI000975E87D|nr:hypothetical protein [Latilactobacillus sakei]
MKSLDKVILGVFITSMVAIKAGTYMVVIFAITSGFLLRSIGSYQDLFFGKEEDNDLDADNASNFNDTRSNRHKA